MKRLPLIKATTVAMLGIAAQSAFAADGTINFVGEIYDAPCSISPNSSDLTVPLGKIVRTALDGSVGKKSTPAQFTIDLLNCGATAKGATVSFSAPTDADSTGLLRIGLGEVAGSSATGVGILLSDSAGTPINVGAASGEYPLVQGDNKLRFQAAYMSTKDKVTTGQANAIAQFTVAYK